MIPCKLQSVQSCIENFYCNITGTIKEITGYRYWGSETPQILYSGAESCVFLDFAFFAEARFPVNSKVYRAAWRTFAASLRVRKRKLLGIGTGGHGPPKFCTGGLKFAHIRFFAVSGVHCTAEFL